MATGTLYTYPENYRAFRAFIAAQYSRAQVHALSTPPHFHFGQTNRTPEFLCKFPAGKYPAFEGDCGFCVFESNAITYYGAMSCCREVAQWVSFADSGRAPPARTWVFPSMGIRHHNKQATQNAKQEVRRILGLLDAHLKMRTFLVVVCTLLRLYKQVIEPSFHQAFPNFSQFPAVLGNVNLCEKMAQSDAKKFAEREAEPQAEWKEKEMAAAPAPEEVMDECKQVLATEPKAKDPSAHLPKSTFVNKDSNKDTLPVALPYFWEHFDEDEYRCPDELTHCNLITGMFQRLDKLRKNAFTSFIPFGTNNSSSISRVWVFRGQELAFPLSANWQVDYESYTRRKLDPGRKVREYFSWEGAFQHVGQDFNQGTIFK
uniref:Elongation factor 1-gamma n=1 Tax=Macaca nemestrina TaxID=9545 RepID=A0A2K6CF26_MACNE